MKTMPPITPERIQKFAARLEFQTFADGDLTAMVGAGLEWLDAFQQRRPARWLTLLGQSGTGKTHVARRLWHCVRPLADFSGVEFDARAIYWPDFVDELRSGEAYGQFNDLKLWPVLFLDDIGAERDPNGFASEKLNTLLGCREGRWTIMTSNFARKDFEARVADRLVRPPNICVGVKTRSFTAR